MKILELFSGTESFSKVARQRGHETFTVDIDEQFKPDLVKDVTKLKPKDIPFKPDVIWCSPPCEKFSILRVSKNWKKLGKDRYEAKNAETFKAMWVIMFTLDFIFQLKPKFWFIENPRAMLRKMPFMSSYTRKTVTYCKYGFPYMKATDIFTNCEAWQPIPICKANDPCHVRAPRGSTTGVQGMSGFRENRNQKHPIDTSRIRPGHLDFIRLPNWDGKQRVLRGRIPPKLCEEILKACENET